MRSLHVVTSTARRGAETFACDLANYLNGMSGHAARVVALAAASGPEHLDIDVLGRGRRDPRTLARLRRSARGVDVVVAHGAATLEACAVSMAGLATPFVFRTIGDPSYWLDGRWRRRVIALLLRRAAYHVVLWPGAGTQLVEGLGIPAHRVDVIPNAVPTERFPAANEADRRAAREQFGVTPSQPCLAYVGALSDEKNLDLVLEIARRVPGAVLLIAGDGPRRREVEVLAARNPSVRYVASMSDPWPVYAAADLLLLPSLTEGMPGVVIEAGLVGTPVLASAVGAVPDLLRPTAAGRALPLAPPEVFGEVAEELLAFGRPRPSETRAHWEPYTMRTVVRQWSDLLARTAGPGLGEGR